MERVGEHAVPAGPLAVRWLGHDVGRPRAGALGAARLALENAGTAAWRDVRLAYHWLDRLGNPIVWDGLRTELAPVAPGGRVELEARLRGPIPPGPYRLAFDLVIEGRFWLAELGNTPLELEVVVAPRIGRALAARGAVAANQEEPLVPESDAEAVAFLAPGYEPAPDWSRRVLDAHQEGYAVVGGSIDATEWLVSLTKRSRPLAPWAPGAGRRPGFSHPLLCPSVVKGIEVEWVEGVEDLPAARPPTDEPWLYDGRITARLRSGRRRG